MLKTYNIIVNLGLLFMYLEVYKYKVVFILCLGFLRIMAFVCTIVETDQYDASTSLDITTVRQNHYINNWWLCFIICMGAVDPQVILIDLPNKTYNVLQP